MANNQPSAFMKSVGKALLPLAMFTLHASAEADLQMKCDTYYGGNPLYTVAEAKQILHAMLGEAASKLEPRVFQREGDPRYGFVPGIIAYCPNAKVKGHDGNRLLHPDKAVGQKDQFEETSGDTQYLRIAIPIEGGETGFRPGKSHGTSNSFSTDSERTISIAAFTDNPVFAKEHSKITHAKLDWVAGSSDPVKLTEVQKIRTEARFLNMPVFKGGTLNVGDDSGQVIYQLKLNADKLKPTEWPAIWSRNRLMKNKADTSANALSRCEGTYVAEDDRSGEGLVLEVSSGPLANMPVRKPALYGGSMTCVMTAPWGAAQ